MELVIYSPTQDQFVKAIEFNFDELRQEMTARLERYNGLVYTDDTIKEAKADRAALNKFKTAIEDKRIEVKKQCLEPYEAFEKKIKQLTALVDAPIIAIDGQVKAFEQAQKDEKREKISTYFSDNIGDLADLLPFGRIFSDKWLNATVKLDAIYKEINETIIRVRADLQTIADLKSDYELQVKDVYLRTLDLSAALNEKTRLEQQKARMAEYEAKKAEKAPAPDFNQLKPGNKVDFSGADASANAPHMEPVKPYAIPVRQIDFRVWATDEQLMELKSFLKSNNIKYGKVV